MKIGVYSLQKVLYEGNVESVNCQTVSGEITILEHHRPLISILKAGIMKIVDKEKKMVVRNAPSMMHPDWKRRVSVKRLGESISEMAAGHRNG